MKVYRISLAGLTPQFSNTVIMLLKRLNWKFQIATGENGRVAKVWVPYQDLALLKLLANICS